MPTVRPAIKSAFFLAFLSALAAAYFLNTPLPLFLTRLEQISLAAFVLWSAGGWGTRIFTKESPFTPLEAFLFAEVLGLGALSGGMILLGVFHAWVPTGAWGLLIAGIGLSGPFLKNVKRLFSMASEIWFLPSDLLWPGAAVLTGGFFSLPLALAPITYYDSLVYHLALPAAYVQAQRWVALPHLVYSAFPQTLEMLWTLALLVGDDTVANLIAWSMSFLLLAAVIAYAKRFLDISVGWVAAALLALMPAFLLLSSGGYVDVGLTLFSFMALYAACVWVAHRSASMLAGAGLFAGWAIGVKYTGALPALLTGIFIATRLYRQPHAFKDLLLFCGSVLLTAGPWLIKNIVYVGNPVFPFFHSWGIQELNPWLHQAAAGYFAGITEYYSRSFWELPRVLWEAAVNGIGFGRGIDVLGDFGWVPLLGLPPALWLCRRLPGMVKLLLIFCAVYFVPWALSHPVLRFLFPIAPLLALLAAYAWVHGLRPQPAWVRWASRGFLTSFLLSGLFLSFYVMNFLSPFAVAAGLESRDAYLKRKLDYYGAAFFVNTQTPPESYVYVFGDQRGYYYQRKIWISPVFSKNLLIEWANASATPAELRRKIQEEGITHMVVNRLEFERLKTYPYARFNAQGQRNWDRLLERLVSLYRDRACEVYAL
ncbi:MAG: hypothetical protein A2992_05805 [Elusimicrobia bacterium RIFCSPLOWO2_01_FULL_59_12]|nr:MAG: hypothetical protein A2992_05805 [Elusimicrobia bacterium RIFCSPLOWO2_01_FULL_59_12]